MEPRTDFIEVECKCGNKQTVFSHVAAEVKCEKCSEVLATPTGGKATITGKVVKVL